MLFPIMWMRHTMRRTRQLRVKGKERESERENNVGHKKNKISVFCLTENGKRLGEKSDVY